MTGLMKQFLNWMFGTMGLGVISLILFFNSDFTIFIVSLIITVLFALIYPFYAIISNKKVQAAASKAAEKASENETLRKAGKVVAEVVDEVGDALEDVDIGDFDD